MSPLSNHTNNNGNSTNTSSLSALNSNNISLAINSNQTNSSNSAFKPLINENRQLNMLSTSAPITTTTTDHYNELATYGGYTHHHHHHHHLNSQLHSAQDYLNSHQTLPLGVYKSDHDDLTGYGFARPVKLYEHGSPMDSTNNSANGIGSSANGTTSNTTALVNGYSQPNNGNGVSSASAGVGGGSGTGSSSGFRGDAPSPGASIIDLSTSSVTSLRTHGNSALANGFPNGAYYDGQRYDRSPQSASSPHYSSPQMLSPQGQTLDLSVGRTR